MRSVIRRCLSAQLERKVSCNFTNSQFRASGSFVRLLATVVPEAQPFFKTGKRKFNTWRACQADVLSKDTDGKLLPSPDGPDQALVQTPAFALTKHLWIDEHGIANVLFPDDHFGEYVLPRPRVVDTIKASIASFVINEPSKTPSVYLSGCRGSGKRNLLMLLASSFHADGYQVYYFDSASGIPFHLQGISFAFEKLLKNRSQKVAVLIDENPNAALFTALLKGGYPHLVVIGAAVPPYSSSRVTDSFVIKMPMSEICLRKTDDDFRQLIDYCVRRNVTTPALTETICRSLLDECGGHVYPTLKFIEYFFSRAPAEVVASEEAFRKFFGGSTFMGEDVYESVNWWCFNIDPEITEAALRVLGGKNTAATNDVDLATVIQMGWWNADTRYFISRTLVNALLSSVWPRPSRRVPVEDLDETTTSLEETTAVVLMQGLSAMGADDFNCLTNVGDASDQNNAVAFNWAYGVKASVAKIQMSFQDRGVWGRVGVRLNGCDVDTAIQVVVNPVDPDSTEMCHSQDIDEHAERLQNDRYPWQRYALFIVAWEQNEVVLPSDRSMWDKTYTFVRASNSLYRGKTLLKEKVMRHLIDDGWWA